MNTDSLLHSLAAEFILDTIWTSYGYSFEAVSDDEWNQTINAIIARGFPFDIREVCEQELIDEVAKLANRNGWLEWLTFNLEELEA